MDDRLEETLDETLRLLPVVAEQLRRLAHDLQSLRKRRTAPYADEPLRKRPSPARSREIGEVRRRSAAASADDIPMSLDVFKIPKDTFDELFYIENVPGDQDCMFHAIAKAMNMYGKLLADDHAHHEFERMCKSDTEYHVLKLRKAAFDIICDTHIDEYNSAFVPSTTEDLDGECTSIEYFCGDIQKLGRDGGVQGNGVVLSALSRMYDIDIYVAILMNVNVQRAHEVVRGPRRILLDATVHLPCYYKANSVPTPYSR